MLDPQASGRPRGDDRQRHRQRRGPRGAHADARPRAARRRRPLPSGAGRAHRGLAAHSRHGRRALPRPPAALHGRARLARLRLRRARGETAGARVLRRELPRAAARAALAAAHRPRRASARAAGGRDRATRRGAVRASLHHAARRRHRARHHREPLGARPLPLVRPARRGGAERGGGAPVRARLPAADRATGRRSGGRRSHRGRSAGAAAVAQALVAHGPLHPARPGGHDEARAPGAGGDRGGGGGRGHRHRRRHGAVRVARPDLGSLPAHLRPRRAFRRLAGRGRRAPGLSARRHGAGRGDGCSSPAGATSPSRCGW